EEMVGGEWLEQVTMPFGLLPAAFLDIDPNVGIGNQFIEALYGYGPDDSPYDIAIGNVGLDAATDAYGWVTSDDWTRGATVPEPATMLLLGSGLVGLAGIARKKRNKK
ncbi:PEP-CTERM sorting domain-containing protein, partial [bacterium]|nr:PEP-CTERM sorting domain-containing protein [bacterium]